MKLHEMYADLVSSAQHGRLVEPRGVRTWERIDPVLFRVPSCMTVLRKGMNRRLAIAESLMLIAGVFSLDVIREVAPHADIDLYKRQSDYGPRTAGQMKHVLRLFQKDMMTRRGIIYFNTDRHFGTDDLACTTSIQWMYREDELQAHVSVRSWDLAFGMPMDIMMYGMLTQALALTLGVQPGDVFITASSVHVYESTMHLAVAKGTLSYVLGVNWPRHEWRWDEAQECARTTLVNLLVDSDDFSNYLVISSNSERNEV